MAFLITHTDVSSAIFAASVVAVYFALLFVGNRLLCKRH